MLILTCAKKLHWPLPPTLPKAMLPARCTLRTQCSPALRPSCSQWYWLAIVGLAIAFGFLGVFLKHLMIFLVCAALGSWLVASSSIGLFDLFGVHTEAWVFYVILGGVGGLGILAHFFLIPKLRGSTSSDKDGQALEETFIRH